MDLLIATAYIWNIFLLLLFSLPGFILDDIEKQTTRDFTKAMEAFKEMPPTSQSIVVTTVDLTATTPIDAEIITPHTTTTSAKQSTTNKSIRRSSLEGNERNYKIKQEKQESHYKQFTKMRQSAPIIVDDSHNIFPSNTTSASATTLSRKRVNEHEQQKQHPKINNKSYDNQTFFAKVAPHDAINPLKDNNKTLLVITKTAKAVLEQEKLLSDLRRTLKHAQSTNAIKFAPDPFADNRKVEQTLFNVTLSDAKNMNRMNKNDTAFVRTKHKNILQTNNYSSSGQRANTSTTLTTVINSFNMSNQATAISTMTTMTTKQSTTLTTKLSHMHDYNNALSYLPYKSAALKASNAAMKTINDNRFDTYSSSSSISSTNNLKRGASLSLAAVLATAKAAVVDNYLMKNFSNSLLGDAGGRENVLKTQDISKSNNSKTHEALAIKQTTQAMAEATPTSKIIKTNETSSSVPVSVSSTYAEIITEAATADPKTTSRATLKTTTRRRKIATTTLKPPPTIDDYQTVTSQAGTHAYLPCNVKQLVKKPISWLRVRDGHILTVDQTTFIADQRFQSIYTVNPERWSLQIKYVQLKDAGIYECQVSTEPKASAIVYLHIVEPKTELIGAPTRHVKAGSQVKLLCIISQALEPPLFINWFYNQKQIYLHNNKGWRTEIERIELPPETTTRTTTTTSKTTTSSTTITATIPIATVTSNSVASSSPSSSLTLSSSSSSTFNGSEIPVTHVRLVTTIAPQQSLNYGNFPELVSESMYNNHNNSIKTEFISTTSSSAETMPSSMSPVSTTLPAGLQETSILDDNTGAKNDDEQDGYDMESDPTASTFEAIAAQRVHMMFSSLMKFKDVKQITTASLIIPSVQKQDSGNYTCSPSNSEPRTVILHVLNGEYSASAITSGAQNLPVKYKLFMFKSSIFTLFHLL